jgi:integrase
MDELTLNEELYNQIADYMKPKYSLTTQRQRLYYIKSIFKKYKVLNRETLRPIMKEVKYQHQRACLVMINKYCYDQNIPFHLIIPTTKRQNFTIPQVLSPAEIELMIQSAPKPYDLAIRCIFNMGAGLRVSEIIKFSWNDIFWIDWLKNKENYGVAVIKQGKGGKTRKVNIPKKLMHDLYEYAKEQEVLNEYRIPMGGMIFSFGDFLDKKEKEMEELLKTNKEKWKAEYVLTRYNWFRYNIIQKHCEKALNKRIRIHQLRHSRSTYLYEYENVPIEKLRDLLGHSSINTTLIYTKINPRSIFELIKDTKEI